MSQLTSSSLTEGCAEDGHLSDHYGREGRRRRAQPRAADHYSPPPSTQPMHRSTGPLDSSPTVCSAPTPRATHRVVAHYVAEHDEEEAAATPTHSGHAMAMSAEGTANTADDTVRSSDGDAAGTLPASHRPAPVVSSPSSRNSSHETARDLRDGADETRLSTSVDHSPVTLRHPIVQFLSSVQLQGYADSLVATHNLHTMADLCALAQSEEAAGQLLGCGASRQHKSDLWKGLQRWSREAAREEKRQALAARKRARTGVPRPSRQQRRLESGDTEQPPGKPSYADNDHEFSLDRVCDALLALSPARTASFPPLRSTAVRAVPDRASQDEGDEDRCTVSRPVSASQLMRALTLSGEEIATLRAKRHARTPAMCTDTLVVDVDAEESLSDEDTTDTLSPPLGSADDASTCRKAHEGRAMPTADGTTRRTASPAVRDVLCSLTDHTCHTTVAGLPRPESSPTAPTSPVSALHHTDESISLCALYRRSASPSTPCAPWSTAENAAPSAAARDSTSPSASACLPMTSQDADEGARLPVTTSGNATVDDGHTDTGDRAPHEVACALRAQLEKAVSALVSEYNGRLDELRAQHRAVTIETSAACRDTSPWGQPVRVVLLPAVEAHTCAATASLPGTAQSACGDEMHVTSPCAVQEVSCPAPLREDSVAELTVPNTRRALWSLHVNDQWGCHGASDEEEDDRTAPSPPFVPSPPPPPSALSPEMAADRLAEVDNELAVVVPAEAREAAGGHAEHAEEWSPSFSPPPKPVQVPHGRGLTAPQDVEGPSSTRHAGRRSSGIFWDHFGLDAIGTAPPDSAVSSSRQPTPQPTCASTHSHVMSVNVDEESEASTDDTECGDESPSRAPSEDATPVAALPSCSPEGAAEPYNRTAPSTMEGGNRAGDAAVDWLLTHGLDDGGLAMLSLRELRERCLSLGLRVPQAPLSRPDPEARDEHAPVASRTPPDTAESPASTTVSSIPLDRFGLNSLDETGPLAPTQLATVPGSAIPREQLLASDSRSCSRSPPPAPPHTTEDVTRQVSPCPAYGSQTPSRTQGRHDGRKRHHHRSDADLCEEEALREQLRLAAVRTRFERVVCPTVFHRLPSFSGLPYYRLGKAAHCATDTQGLDAEQVRQLAKNEEHEEYWRCTLAALAGDAARHLENYAESQLREHLGAVDAQSPPAVAKTPLSLMEKLLLLEPLDCDAVTALVHDDFAHIARARVRQIIVDSGVSIDVVTVGAEALGPSVSPGRGASPPASCPSPSSPQAEVASGLRGAPSPEQTRRANARKYFATRGMPVRGGRQGMWRGRGGRGAGRGGGRGGRAAAE